jgi:hypothetical protein
MLGVFHITSLHSENVQCAPNHINIFYVAQEGLALLSMAQCTYAGFTLLNFSKWKCVLCNYCRKRVNVWRTRQAVYVDARSCNNCCCGRAMSIIQSVCVCSFRLPARSVHAPCCHLWRAPLYNMFLHFLIKSIIIEKNATENKTCVLIFSTTLVWDISHSRRNERDMIKKNCVGLHVKYPLFWSATNETRIFSKFFRWILKYKISLNQFSASRVVPPGRTDGRTNRHDETNSSF